MEQFSTRVALITGGASGIGLGIARACARQGMNLVLADVEANALEAAAQELGSSQTQVVTKQTDVTDPAAVEALADLAYRTFGAVNVLCNNAGVIENNKPAWEYSLDDWDWVLGVNVMGVVHGIKSFVPRMLTQGEPAHIVNTASVGGLIAGIATPIYVVSKHAVVALSECVYNSLARVPEDVNISVLCPGWVNTAIVDSDRNRDGAPEMSESDQRSRSKFRAGVESGMDPNEVGEIVLDGIRQPRFYILTHPQLMSHVEERFAAMKGFEKPASTILPLD
ncbi:MAG: SDR family NAD(P)-dependent oxidoreductase [Pseudomonadota bacterium]